MDDDKAISFGIWDTYAEILVIRDLQFETLTVDRSRDLNMKT